MRSNYFGKRTLAEHVSTLHGQGFSILRIATAHDLSTAEVSRMLSMMGR